MNRKTIQTIATIFAIIIVSLILGAGYAAENRKNLIDDLKNLAVTTTPTPTIQQSPTPTYTSTASPTPTKKPVQETLDYVVLGDSYSQGYGVTNSWPMMLTSSLKTDYYKLNLTSNFAKFGDTTEDVLKTQLPKLKNTDFDLLSVMVGTNDFAFINDIGAFRYNLGLIFASIAAEMDETDKVFIVTIPDISEIPGGQKWALGRDIKKVLQEYNDVIKQEAKKRNFLVIDIFDVSIQVEQDVDKYYLDDEFHPNEKGYQIWVSEISRVLRNYLDDFYK